MESGYQFNFKAFDCCKGEDRAKAIFILIILSFGLVQCGGNLTNGEQGGNSKESVVKNTKAVFIATEELARKATVLQKKVDSLSAILPVIEINLNKLKNKSDAYQNLESPRHLQDRVQDLKEELDKRLERASETVTELGHRMTHNSEMIAVVYKSVNKLKKQLQVGLSELERLKKLKDMMTNAESEIRKVKVFQESMLKALRICN